MWKKIPPSFIALVSCVGASTLYHAHTNRIASNLNNPLMVEDFNNFTTTHSNLLLDEAEITIPQQKSSSTGFPEPIPPQTVDAPPVTPKTLPSAPPVGESTFLVQSVTPTQKPLIREVTEQEQDIQSTPSTSPITSTFASPMLLDPQVIDLLALYELNINLTYSGGSSGGIPPATRK